MVDEEPVEQPVVLPAPTLLGGGSNTSRSSNKKLLSTKITDYFGVQERRVTTRRSQDIMEIEELWSRVQARARLGWWRRQQGVQGVQVIGGGGGVYTTRGDTARSMVKVLGRSLSLAGYHPPVLAAQRLWNIRRNGYGGSYED